jgi:hypothetical protein
MNNNDYKLTNNNGYHISIKRLVEVTFNVKAHNNELYIAALILNKLGFSHLEIIKNLMILKEGK